MPKVIGIVFAVVMLSAGEAADCSEESYEIDGGLAQSFLVQGHAPGVAQSTGSVVIVDVEELQEDLFLVTLRCESSATCTGIIYGC